jgi:osmotically-inducible protein OsmY
MRIPGSVLCAAIALSTASAGAGPPSSPAPSATPARAVRDAEIEYRIVRALGLLEDVDTGDVHVASVRGAVRLYGTIGQAVARGRILVTASRVFGVRVLRDELTLRSAPSDALPDDAQLEQQARAAVQFDRGAMERPLQVQARRGVVTLRGRVATYDDALRVLRAVKSVSGVRTVRSGLVVNEAIVIPVGRKGRK